MILDRIKSIIDNYNEQQHNELLKSKDFNEFYEKNKDKSIEDIALEYDLNIDLVKLLM